MRIRESFIIRISVLFFILIQFLIPSELWSVSNAYNEGMRLMKTGDFKRAAEMLAKARKDDPKNLRLMYQLGLAYYNIEEIDKAQRLWRKAAEMMPEKSMMKTTLLDIIKRAEKRKTFLKRKKRLAAVIGNGQIPLEEGLELASLYKEGKEYLKAVNLYKRITAVYPDEPRAYIGVAEINYMEGRILWAQRYYGLALEHGSNDPDVKRRVEDMEEYLRALGDKGYEAMVKQAHGRAAK